MKFCFQDYCFRVFEPFAFVCYCCCCSLFNFAFCFFLFFLHFKSYVQFLVRYFKYFKGNIVKTLYLCKSQHNLQLCRELRSERFKDMVKLSCFNYPFKNIRQCLNATFGLYLQKPCNHSKKSTNF